jgi:putative membrane protein insertion efficiency factor
VTLATRLAVGSVRAYQSLVSPFLPSACRFAPTCSEYAKRALVEHGVLRGGALAVWRLARCHPFHPGGYDPPPVRARQA